MIDHENLIDQLDTIRMANEMIIKTLNHLNKIESPIHRSFFSIKARFFDLIATMGRYEDAIQRMMQYTEEEE